LVDVHFTAGLPMPSGMVPPQSTSVSPSEGESLPSLRRGASHFCVVHVAASQSVASTHPWPWGHTLVALIEPPQSTPVSPAFLRPSMCAAAVTATHFRASHTSLVQSRSAWQGSPSMQSVGRPTPHVFVPGGAHLFRKQMSLVHSAAFAQVAPSHFLQRVPPQSMPSSSPLCFWSVHVAAVHLFCEQLRLTQSPSMAQAAPSTHFFGSVAPHFSGAASAASAVAPSRPASVEASGGGGGGDASVPEGGGAAVDGDGVSSGSSVPPQATTVSVDARPTRTSSAVGFMISLRG
jgi:hypothetical protein